MLVHFQGGPLNGWRVSRDESSDEIVVGFKGPPSWTVTLFAADVDWKAYESEYNMIGEYAKSPTGYEWKGKISG